MKKNLAWLKAKPFAHRGLFGAGRPENSLSAIRQAVELGFPVEIDVQATRDGRVMVFHDWSLERMTGEPALISESHWGDLTTLRLAKTEEGIPLLEDVLAAVAGRVGVLIEIKTRGSNRTTETATASLLDGYEGAYAVQSFNPRSLLWFKNHRPHFIRGQISCRFATDRKAAWKKFLLSHYVANGFTRPDFIAHDWRQLPAWAPLTIKRFLRLPLLGWTVKSQVEHDRCLVMADNTIFEGFIPD